MFHISDKILLTIWIGTMWSVGYIVAPVLFNMLEKDVAGNVAGQLFSIVSYIGLFCATFLLINLLLRHAFHLSRHHWQFWLILFMLTLIIIGEFLIQPMMAEIKLKEIDGTSGKDFSRLHGIASVLYLVNSLAGLALVIFGPGNQQTKSVNQK